jgi:hypothetical protein
MMIPVLALGLSLSPGYAQEDAVRKTIEDFKASVKEAKSVQDKALLILALADTDPRDPALARELAHFLVPAPSDLNFVVPVAAIDALSKFRGSAPASQALLVVLPTYKKLPYLYPRAFRAIAKIGHETGISFYQDFLHGTDPELASLAVSAMEEMPAGPALELLFREWDRLHQQKGGVGDAQKRVNDRITPEIDKMIHKISGEIYTMKEMPTWWQRHQADFKAKSLEKEKERAGSRAPADAARPSLAPILLVELTFRENSGLSAGNTGSSSGLYPSATLTQGRPSWTGTPVPNAGPSALDFGTKPGPHAVDLGQAGVEHLKNLKSFTLAGWLNCRDMAEGGGGNRVLSWVQNGKDGVDLVFRSDGSLQLGVNQWADAGSARSAPGQLVPADEKVRDGLNNNWKFFAVTYDSTQSAGQAKFYFGSRTADATLVTTVDYAQGAAGSKIAPSLAVGNVASVARPTMPDRMFRGMIDEVRIWGSTVDGGGALDPGSIVKVQNRQPPVPPGKN